MTNKIDWSPMPFPARLKPIDEHPHGNNPKPVLAHLSAEYGDRLTQISNEYKHEANDV